MSINHGGNISKYRAVFFDAGNTLLCPHPAVEDVCNEVFCRSGYHVEIDEIKRAVAVGDRYYEERYWKDDTFWRSETEARALWIDLYSLVAAELGINGDSRCLASEIYSEFGLHHRWKIFDDVELTLNELKRRGMRLGVISNWDMRLPGICARLGLSDYFDFIISSATVGRFKPDPEIFKMGLKRMGLASENVIHVGDHYYADVLGARSVDITPVLIDRVCSSGNFDCIRICDMKGLLEFIDSGIYEGS